MAVLGIRDDAVERCQRLLVFQPGFTAAARCVDRIRILDDEAFIRACARGVEKLVDVRRVANLRLIAEADRMCGSEKRAETRETLTLLLDLAARVPAEPTRFGVFRM